LILPGTFAGLVLLTGTTSVIARQAKAVVNVRLAGGNFMAKHRMPEVPGKHRAEDRLTVNDGKREVGETLRVISREQINRALRKN
jgi:hypothetical protein